jgi:hypothetical protein
MTTFRAGDTVELRINAKETGNYLVYVTGLAGRDKSVLAYSIDHSSSLLLDWYGNNTANSWSTRLVGEFPLQKGNHTLTVRNTGTANPLSSAGKGSFENVFPADQAAGFLEQDQGVPVFLPDSLSGTGMAVTSLSGELSTNFPFDIPATYDYYLFLRAKSAQPGGLATITLGNASISVALNVTGKYEEYAFGPFHLGAGHYVAQATIKKANTVALDWIGVVSTGQGSHTLASAMSVFPQPKPLAYTRVSPTKFQLQIPQSDSRTRVINFLESYDSQWILRSGDATLKSLPVYGYANSFMVGSSGGQMTLEFSPASLQGVGVALSAATLVILVIAIFFPQVAMWTRGLRRARGFSTLKLKSPTILSDISAK